MPRKAENYYEQIGSNFDRFMSDYDVERRTALIRDLWPDTVTGPSLEVGCGTGAITAGIIARSPQLTVTDISAKLAAQAGDRFGVPHQQADANDLPFQDGTFGLVVSSECIEHTPDPARGILEMVRVCRPGGYVILTTPNRLWYPIVRGAQLLHLRKFPGNEVFLSLDEMLLASRRSGGQVEMVSGCHLFPWQVPLAKPALRRIDSHGTALFRLMINIGIRIHKPEVTSS